MDGMLLVTFFFPALSVFNFSKSMHISYFFPIIHTNPPAALSVVTFFLTLGFTYGPELYRVAEDALVALVPGLEPNPHWEQRVYYQQSRVSTSLLWPILVSTVTIWTTLTTYGFGGAARHGKSGWRFVQPGSGGLTYVLLQFFTWTCAALSIAMPWTTVKQYGWFTLLGVVPDRDADPASSRGLLVVGSALGVLANTYCLIGLMVYSEKEKGKNWHLLGSSQAWWWLFLLLQFTLVFCSWQLAIMMEMQESGRKTNNVVQCLLLCIVCCLLAVPLALTNAVAGKWRHGDAKFHLSMPFQGGRVFALLQAMGWITFALALTSMLIKMHSIVTLREEESMVKLSYTAFFGVLSFLFIAGSLFWFDPNKVEGGSEEEEEEEEEEENVSSTALPTVEAVAASTPNNKNGSSSSSGVHSLLGKRKGRGGGLEYLVEWRADSVSAVWVPERELLLRDAGAIQRNGHLIQTPSSNGSSGRSRARSASPGIRYNRRAQAAPAAAEEESSDDEEDDEDEDEEELEEVDGEDVWEEVEDENGNVFYYHEGKNLTRFTAPSASSSSSLAACNAEE